MSISLHEVSRINTPLPLLCLGMGKCRKRSFLSLGGHCMAMASQFTHCQCCSVSSCIVVILKNWPGKRCCPGVLWKGFTCANCMDLNLHRHRHNKAYIPGSFLSSYRSPTGMTDILQATCFDFIHQCLESAEMLP